MAPPVGGAGLRSSIPPSRPAPHTRTLPRILRLAELDLRGLEPEREPRVATSPRPRTPVPKFRCDVAEDEHVALRRNPARRSTDRPPGTTPLSQVSGEPGHPCVTARGRGSAGPRRLPLGRVADREPRMQPAARAPGTPLLTQRSG